MLSETHLIIVWQHATQKLNEIISDVSQNFIIKNVSKITWSKEHFSDNLTRFYGQNLPADSDKEKHIGNGSFYSIIFMDMAPKYGVRETTQGPLTVNTNIFDAKQKYRKWTSGGHKIHGTNSQTEALHDIWLLLGRSPDEFVTTKDWDGHIDSLNVDLLGANGWQNIEEFFAALNNCCNYIVLRNFEPLPNNYHLEEHGDIDLLVDDIESCVYVSNGKKVFGGDERVHYAVNIAGEDIPFDFRYVGDSYYDKAFQTTLLENREFLQNCFYAPKSEDYFYSLLYHALIHKEIFAEDYSQRLQVLGRKVGIEFDGTPLHASSLLASYLYKNDYDYVRPVDETVYYNSLWANSYKHPPPLTKKITEAIENTKNLSVLSTDLRHQCTDWLSQYHLSNNRANILRPFHELLANADVLEIGSGCGAITRYLGECGANVVTLETSPKRANITKLRVRDLQNIDVVIEQFDKFKCDKKFDIITLIGTLEYASLFSSGKQPALSILKRTRKFLKPHGKLIIATENQLGLKYFAVTPEDHPEEFMYGIEERYHQDQPRTFGRKVLIQLLNDTGFINSKFLFPFPDYKSPISITTEQGIENPGFDTVAFTYQSFAHDPQLPKHLGFSLELAWSEIFKNGLAMDMANSFLIIASPAKEDVLNKNILAYHYSTNRLPKFCKEACFVKTESDHINVHYNQLTSFDNLENNKKSPKQSFLFDIPSTAPYIHGKLLSFQFVEILNRPGWSFAEIEGFAQNYLDAITSLALDKGVKLKQPLSITKLPRDFFDLLPQNIIVKNEVQFDFFDLEWISNEEVPLNFLMFRGLFVCLGNITKCAKPTDERLLEWKHFIQQAASACGTEITDEEYINFLERELHFREFVIGEPVGSVDVAQSYRLTVKSIETIDIALAKRDTAIAERDTALAERDLALDHIDYIKNTWSWKLTKPLRFCFRLSQNNIDKEFLQRLKQRLRHRYNLLPLPNFIKRSLSFFYRKLLRKAFCFLRYRSLRFQQFHPPTFTPLLKQEGKPDYIVWGVIDWHFRYQRPQQLCTSLVETNRRVFYVSPILIDDGRSGFEIDTLDTSKQLFQVKLFLKSAPNIYSSTLTPKLNDQLKRSLGEVLNWADCEQVISLVQHPFWYDVASLIPNSRLIYDCMDHHEGFKNTGQHLQQLERNLLQQAELTIVTSSWIDKLVSPYAKKRTIIRNAGDYTHFSKSPENIYHDPEERPIIGYYGAIAEWFDVELVELIAKQHPECCVLLIGADTNNVKSKLHHLSNISFIGEVPYDELPYYLYSFDICLLPFKVNPLTKATNPVKVYEYLSAGKPVVSVDLPEMEQFGNLVYTASDKKSFLMTITNLLKKLENDDLIQSRKMFAEGQTWKHRAKNLIQHIESVKHNNKASIIVVTYNNIELTRKCLASLDKYNQYENSEIIVVDNASSDGTPDFLLDWSTKSEQRKVILNEDNKGFAAANNQGLTIADGDYLVLLNNDTHVTPGWLSTLIKHLERNPSIGLVGPVTNNIGNEAKIDINYIGMDDMLKKSAAYTRRHIGEVYPLRTAAFFCVMMTRTTYKKVGLLDEAFGRGFFEDDDYCRRIEKLGLRVVCAEDVFVHHHLSASFDKLRVEERQKLFEENKILYEAKWGAWEPHSYRDTGL